MTLTEKKVLGKFMRGEISREELLEIYPINLANNQGYFLQVLNEALESRVPGEVDYAISLMTADVTFNTSEKYVAILCKLLEQDWHYRHQDIVALLQGIKSPQSVDCVYSVALKEFEYRSYDSSYSLARACVHALIAIRSEHAIDRLRDLANCNVEEVRQYTLRELDKYGIPLAPQ